MPTASRRPPEQAERLLLAAFDAGVTLFDTAALYGFGANETLVGRVLQPHSNRFTLASKGGLAGVPGEDGMKRVIDGRPEAISRNCEDSLRRLQTDAIDLYYLHRWDKKDVKLDAGLSQRLEALINQDAVTGNRYGEQSNREVDTEAF